MISLDRITLGEASLMLTVGLVAAMLCGCAIDITRLSSCHKSGEVRFDAIPIASKNEHELAWQFKPSNPDNCLVYVVREHDCWTGASLRRTLVILTPAEFKYPVFFPADRSELHPLFGDQILTITDDVFAMWELHPESYILSAFFERDYWRLVGPVKTWVPLKSIDKVKLECQPGGVLFFAVGDQGFRHEPVLNIPDTQEGKEYVRKGLRSVGYNDFENSAFRDCEGKW